MSGTLVLSEMELVVRELGKLDLIADLLAYMQEPRTHSEIVQWLDRE